MLVAMSLLSAKVRLIMLFKVRLFRHARRLWARLVCGGKIIRFQPSLGLPTIFRITLIMPR